MSKKWHSGPPPFPGWWNASVSRDESIWRWWNGLIWSVGITNHSPANDAGFLARRPYIGFTPVEWTDYWPPNARVPRIDPRKKS